MLGKIKELSIKWKLVAIITIVTNSVLLLTLVLYIFSQILSFKNFIYSDLKTFAGVLGKNTTSALVFNDPATAEEHLGSLESEKYIIEARIYNSKGRLFSIYQKYPTDTGESVKFKIIGELKENTDYGLFEGIPFLDPHIDIFEPIIFDNERIGTLYLKMKMSKLNLQILSQIKITLMILGLSSIITFILATRIQSLFSKPILSLTNAMGEVTQISNYKIRLKETASDEIGMLISGFNKMLSQIEERDKKLDNHRNQLEIEVLKRTSDLNSTMEKLKHAKEEAEASDRAKSTFLANMSHELRTPLNHIIGFTELIVDQHFGELNEIQLEYLEDVLTSSRHLLSLINDILDLSKVESGRMDLNATETSLRELLSSSFSMVKEKTLAHGIKLETLFPEDSPLVINADQRKLKQVMYNLLSNAVKFTEEKGCIRISAILSYITDLPERIKKMSRFKNREKDLFVLISVEDSGIGIAAKDLARIFNSFEQVESTMSRKFQGTGLGLSLTKELVELHGGCIWAESEGEGKGSRFSFILPYI